MGTAPTAQAIEPSDAGTGATKFQNSVVGNVGLYYVCYRLSQRGWNVMPTARNARGVDLIAYSNDAKRVRTIQVKALSKRAPVPLGTGFEAFIADFIVVCGKALTSAPECFVLTPEEVRSHAHRGEKEGRVSYWLQPKAYEVPAYREAWDRIGHGHGA